MRLKNASKIMNVLFNDRIFCDNDVQMHISSLFEKQFLAAILLSRKHFSNGS